MRPPDGGTIDPSQVNLYCTASNGSTYLVLENLSQTCDLGWHYADDTKTEIELCGSTCAQIKGDPEAELTEFLGCPSQTFLP